MATEHEPAGGAPDDDQDVEILLEGDSAAHDAGAAGDAAGDHVVPRGPAEPDYGALKRQLEEQNSARQAAERRAEAAEPGAQGDRIAAIDGRLGQVNAAIGEMTSTSARLKRELAEAHQSGDYAKVADLTEKVGEAGATMRDLTARKAEWEAYKKAPPQPQRQPVLQSADPVEAFAANRAPKEQAWIRANPDFVRDAKKFQKLQGAHALASADHEPGSEGYFAAINATLGIKPGAALERRPAGVSAPVSRDAPSLSRPAGNPTSIRLTADDRRMAEAMGVDLKSYAREKAKVAAAVARGEQP